MIGDVTRSLVGALENARQGTAFEAAEIRACAGGEEPPATGVTVCLAGVAIDQAIRNTALRPGGRHSPPELGVILHYLVTPRSGRAYEQQDMLAWLLRSASAAPLLTVGGGQVRLKVETLPLEAEARLWQALHPGRPLLPSLHVEVRAPFATSPAP